MTAYERVTTALQDAGSRRSGNDWQCPAHDDRSPSLSVTHKDGKALLCCQTGCATGDVVAALGLTVADLFDKPLTEQRDRPQVVAEYPYTDEHGEVLLTVRRLEPGYGGKRKTFLQYGPDGTPGVKGIRKVLYRLPEVLAAAQAGGIVFVAEGEKDADNLAVVAGVASTCNVGGAGKWRDEYTGSLRGASEVIVIADRDEPGRKHADAVADSVRRAGISVRVVEPATGKDATDHLQAGYGLDDFRAADIDVADEADPGEDVCVSRELPPPSNPMAVARELEPAWRDENGILTVRHWRGTWMSWRGSHWKELDDAEVRASLYKTLEHATYVHVTPKGEEETRNWAPTKRKIADLTEALAAVVHLPPSVDAPAWVAESRSESHVSRDGGSTKPQVGRAESHESRFGEKPSQVGLMSPVVACENGLLQVSGRKLRPLTPEFFNLVSVPYDYDPDAVAPNWDMFLKQLWPDDPESIAALQEFFGCVLSGRTDQQKILLVVGPTRSGKGTIARILAALVGKGNMAGPTLASLSTNFGLSPLLGKSLAVISDARLSGRDGHQVIERLLTISGEDTIDVDRKYKDPWTGKLPTRIVILSNELPNFGDASGVIARRFIVLNMTVSWLGKEDTGLTDKLASEMPGILNWALGGLARLEKNGSPTVLPTWTPPPTYLSYLRSTPSPRR